MQVAVVEDSAARRNLEGTLLLPGGTVYVVFVMDDLQPDQAAADQHHPGDKEKRNIEQAEATMHRTGRKRARRGLTWLWGSWLRPLLTMEEELFQLHLPWIRFTSALV